MTLPDIRELKRPLFAVAFFTLVIYMANRAIVAIVYPFDSQILESQSQEEAASLFGVDLEFNTFYVANSVVFPLLLVIFYRLANLQAKKLLLIVLSVHYLSVACVSAFAWYATHEEIRTKAYGVTQYEDANGRLFTQVSQQGSAPEFGLPVNVDTDDDGRAYFEYGDDQVVYLTEREDPALTWTATLEYYYSISVASLLALLSLLLVPLFYRFDYSAAFALPKPDTAAA